MESQEIKDKSGVVFHAKHFNGRLFSPHVVGNVKDHLESLQKFTFGPQDVLIWGYPKSGNHWLFEVVNMLLSGSLEYHKQFLNICEFLPMDKLESIKEPRTLVTHVPLEYLPRDVVEKKRKILHLYRNPKDVAVSYYTFKRRFFADGRYNGKWEDFLDLFLEGKIPFGSWFDLNQDIKKFKEENPDYPIITVCFEDMKKGFTSDEQLRSFTDEKSLERRRNQDLKKEVKRIASFLECNHEEGFLEKVENKCETKTMLAVKIKDVPPEIAQFSEDGTSNVFYRKGDVGDWKNWFTVAQNELFDRVYEKKAPKIGLDVKYTI